MKIAQVQTYRVLDRWLFCEITTDSGIVGLGEAGLWAYPDAAEGALKTMAGYLVGQDPMRIEHHHQYLYRNAHFQGAAISGALGAIDIALWDIKARHYGAPIWDLLGGRCRDEVRAFTSVRGNTLQELSDSAQALVDRGFTCVRVFANGPDYTQMTMADRVTEGVERVSAVRDTVGPHVDIGVELHRRWDGLHSVALAQALVPINIAFFEDPLLPDSLRSKERLAPSIPLPIATGERLCSIYQFRELLESETVRWIRPDVCLSGGFTQTMKICAMAESYQVGLIPHHPLSPVCSAAMLQFEAAVPNVVIHEYQEDDDYPRNQILDQNVVFKDGNMRIPETPGLGVTLNHEGIAAMGSSPRKLTTPLRYDGSIADQ